MFFFVHICNRFVELYVPAVNRVCGQSWLRVLISRRSTIVLQLIKFLKGFTAEERVKLAKVVGYCLANGLGSAACVSSLFEEHLIKDGLWCCYKCFEKQSCLP